LHKYRPAALRAFSIRAATPLIAAINFRQAKTWRPTFFGARRVNGLVIGKRITVGAAITSSAGLLTHFFPQHGPAFIAAAVPITFIAQIIIAKKFGITTK
jgi:hypothetical protein